MPSNLPKYERKNLTKGLKWVKKIHKNARFYYINKLNAPLFFWIGPILDAWVEFFSFVFFEELKAGKIGFEIF